MAPVNGSGPSSSTIDDPFRNLPNELLSRIFILCGDFPLRVFFRRFEVPHQFTVSQVCSRWRQVALSTGVLWSSFRVTELDTKFAHRLRLYRTLVGRAGDCPLTVSLFFYGPNPDVYKVFLDFVVPFRIKLLDITMPYHKLVDLPPSSVEEYAIVVTHIQADEDLKVPPFMDKTRDISIWDSAMASDKHWGPKLKELCLSWHQLRDLGCYSRVISLSTWLDVLRQSGTLQYLEQCHLTISNDGSGPLVGVCMPNLRWLSLTLLDVQPDIVIPLIAAPNITILEISSQDKWSSDAYDIIKRHYKLHQMHQIRLQGAGFTLRVAQILADAPMVHKLECLGTSPILDTEAREGIGSGRLGRCLRTLHIAGCFDNAGEWLDMIETRQRNVKSIVTQVSNWREMFTGIRSVELWDVLYGTRIDCEERVAALRALGTTVKLI